MKIRFGIVMGLVFFLASACSSSPTGSEAGRDLVNEAAAAMGGWAALDAIKSQEIIADGADWEPLQAVALDADSRQVNNFKQTTVVDFEKKRMRLTFDAVRVYPAPGPVKFTEVIDGDVAMLQSTDAAGKPALERL